MGNRINMSNATNEVDESIETFLKCMRNRDWAPALELLRANRELAKVINDMEDDIGYVGTLPLHIACFYKAPRELIELLLQKYPDASKERDRFGRLALHLLFEEDEDVHQDENENYDISEEVVDALIEANPSAAAAKTDDDELPLHFAAQNVFASGKAVLRLLAEYPKAASVANQDGYYPLHLVCLSFDGVDERDSFCEIVEALLKAYPDAATLKNENGCLPLHYCICDIWRCWDEKIIKVFKIIFDANRDAAKAPSDQGRLPLHNICLSAPSEPLTNWHMKMFDYLMEANTKAVCVPYRDGCLPLHYACREWPISCKDMLAKLMAANPRAIHTPDIFGRTPLDYAMRRRIDSAEFVRELFAVSSGGIMLAQLEGMTLELEGMTVAFAGAMAQNKMLEEELKDAKKHNKITSV